MSEWISVLYYAGNETEIHNTYADKVTPNYAFCCLCHNITV